MPRNFDTTNGQPFVYFDIGSIIKDPQSGVITVNYSDRMALKDSDGVTRFLDGGIASHQFQIAPSQLGQTVPVVDLATGANTGVTIALGHVMAGIIAAVRADQVKY